MNINKVMGFKAILILIILGLIVPVFGTLNPSAVYCEQLGYGYKIMMTEEGEKGICILTNKEEVDSWDFLKGKVGEDYTYCKQQGYEIKTILDREKCADISSKECAVCVLPNGTEIEVTKLMNLSFEEGSCGDNCGDNICVLGEDYSTCPQDCPSGSYDGYCDGLEDGICDPDCLSQLTPESDSDCPVCGNNICEQEETYNTCPQDCQSQICGDGKCDSGETRENCCVDCGCIGGMKCQAGKCVKTEICGDGICSIHENYEKCKEDCPSGSKDNYCDKIEDNICDPDCTRTRDVDCLCNKDNICDSNFETNSNCPEDCKSNFSWVYIIIGIVVVISAIFFLKKRSSSTDKWKKMYYGNSK